MGVWDEGCGWGIKGISGIAYSNQKVSSSSNKIKAHPGSSFYLPSLMHCYLLFWYYRKQKSDLRFQKFSYNLWSN
jgi:hypothetical protein